MLARAGTRIRYMGNKVALASDVATQISELERSRTLVDLFGGMCSIAGAVSRSERRVWVNDAQHYAELVAKCLLRSQEPPPSRDQVAKDLLPAYRENLQLLSERFADDLKIERRVLGREDGSSYGDAQSSWKHVGNSAKLAEETAALRGGGQAGPYRLATLTFAWGYFGLRQSIEIDSLRAAIDSSLKSGTLSEEEAAWCRLALLQTCSRAASSPGHFAQFLSGHSEQGYRRIQASRRQSIWDGVLGDLGCLKPFGTKRWRARNKVLRGDALEIWGKLDDAKLGPAIFYADPPYSKEQYSRFYHVLESLELYDYPDSTGIGRYRSDRLMTPLAQKSGVLGATKDICKEISDREGILLLSYPSTGLLTRDLEIDIAALLAEFFDDVKLPISATSAHSTLGGRHGKAKRSVTEYVWIAQ